MRLVQRLLRRRSGLRYRRAQKTTSRRLVFEYLENRCLLSSGFDSGIISTNTLRSPFLDGEARRQISIFRFSSGLLTAREALIVQHDDALYDGDRVQIVEASVRPNERERRFGKNDVQDTETRDRRRVLNGVGPDIAGNDREPLGHERQERLQRPEPATPSRPKPARPWPGELSESGHAGWARNKPDRIRQESVQHSQTETEEKSSDELSALTALSPEALAAFYGVQAVSIGQDETIDANLLAAAMMCEDTAESNRLSHWEIGGGRLPEEWDETLYLASLDCALSSLADSTSDTVPAEEVSRVQAGPATTPSSEQSQMGMAVAAAVVVASRVESNQRQRREQKSRGLGWLGSLAQFVVSPRFTTPRRPTILLAMREDLVRERFAGVLRDDGYDVVDFGTLSEASKHVTASWITLDGAVMDAELDFSGIHLLTKIREKYPKLPVVVCGEPADNGDMIQYRRLGARRCLLKPVDLSELLATVNALVW